MKLRRAALADLDFLADLYADEDVRPWLAAGGRYDADGLRTQIERFDAEPAAAGLLVIELDGEPVGAMAWERVNERSRIAQLGGLAIHPAFRGRRLADEAARMLQTASRPRARLPPAAARGVRLQRAGAAPRGAGRLRPRGREAEGLPPRRGVGRRRPLRPDRGRPQRALSQPSRRPRTGPPRSAIPWRSPVTISSCLSDEAVAASSARASSAKSKPALSSSSAAT